MNLLRIFDEILSFWCCAQPKAVIYCVFLPPGPIGEIMKFSKTHQDDIYTDYTAEVLSAEGVVIEMVLTAISTGGGYMTFNVGSEEKCGDPSGEIPLTRQQVEAILGNSGIMLGSSAKAPEQLEAGDKVFVRTQGKLATVLDVYGDPINGNCGDVRLDLCGNTPVTEIEKYDAAKHAAYDHTFIPITAEWKGFYGITKDVPLRDQQ